MATERWRVGNKVPINVYEGDKPICQCHSALDAQRIVEAMNAPVRQQIGTATVYRASRSGKLVYIINRCSSVSLSDQFHEGQQVRIIVEAVEGEKP